MGGAIETSAASFSAASTLIASNSRAMCAGAITDGGHNLAFVPAPAVDPSCPGIGGDPLLGTLAADGGFAETVPLQVGSAAIDQVPVGSACPSADERGVPRPQPPGGKCDIGAYEFAPPTCSAVHVTTPADTAARVSLSCLDPAGVAVAYALDRGPSHGSLARLDATAGTVTYTPRPGFVGSDAFGYHASDANGTASSVSVTITVTPRAAAPAISRLRIRPASFRDRGMRRHGRRRGRLGATVSYLDSAAATTRFTVSVARRCIAPAKHRRSRKCVRFVSVGAFTHADHAGSNRFAFSGVVRGRRLTPGSYRLSATPMLGRLRGRPKTISFRILKP
jgi:Bacterial Ig domain